MNQYFFILTIQATGGRYTLAETTQVLQPSDIYAEARTMAIRKYGLSSTMDITVEFFGFWNNSPIQ